MNTRYAPQPLNTGKTAIPVEVEEIIECLAKHVHEVWAQRRLAEGWRYGLERNDTRKEHPSLVSYEELSENEKEYDRHTAMATIRFLLSHGFEIIRRQV
ncbi:MAG: Ryanodine receptor Ryr [Tannerella sp.]|jgi:hypothetical protein|nr:Ryanodine receptor Ryr [Tannerella sp.]